MIHEPQQPFSERVSSDDLELRGVRARALQFPEGVRDRSRGLVCIAGMGANGRSFVRQRPLSREQFVLMLNTPVDTPPDEPPLAFSVEVLEEYLAHEGLERPVLLGSSFGGTCAALAAMRAPEKYRALILVSAPLSRWQIPLAFPGFVDVLEAPTPIAALMSPLAAEVMGGFALDRDARNEIVREARHFSGNELKRRLSALMHLDLRPRLSELRLPVLWVHGSRDLLVPWRRGRRVAAQIPGARFELIKGAGHLPYLSHPAPFNALVQSFLDGHA